MLKEGLEYLKDNGALSVQPTSNGQHIHISKKFFEHGSLNCTDLNTAYQNFDWLFQKFQPEIEKLGEREYTTYCRSKKMQAENEINNIMRNNYNTNLELDIKGKLKKGGMFGREDHSLAVNSTDKTIEARVFKSTTDYKTVLARIEIMRNFAHAVREKDVEKTLNELLHTKDNKYLDEYIQKVRMQCKKNKEEFNLEKINTDELELTTV